jgi:hypothetical protein
VVLLRMCNGGGGVNVEKVNESSGGFLFGMEMNVVGLCDGELF